VKPAEEAPIEIVPVGRDDPAPEPPSVASIDPATEPLSPDPRRYDLIEEAYRESALPDGESAREWRRSGGESGSKRSREPGDGERVRLDPVGDDRAAKTPLHRAIRRRGSSREYEHDTLNGRKVATVLDRAVRGPPMDVGGDAALAFNDAYLLVNDLDGIPPGSYHYHPEEAELERMRDGTFREEAARLALGQRLAGDAALCAYFMTDLDAVTERLGNRGYRAAQLEAAITAGRLYLGAYAHHDLGATGLTFFDDLATEFFEPRAAGQTPMFLWTLGRPA
jgi:SagB-type dehydrogenase family enzyme